MTTAPSPDAIANAVQRVLPQARAAWLFGSGAKGQLRDDSDLDIAVSLAEMLTPHQQVDAAGRLQDLLGYEVDLLDFMRLHTVMQYQVLTTGNLLFDHTPAFTAGYGAFVTTEYQNIQTWRKPLVRQLTERLSHA